jgi:septal ring factor EnvC (AmiA/AmiB activator)
MPPSDIVRSAVLLRGIVPRIEEKAAEVRAELVSLVDTRAAITSKRLQLTEMDARLKKEHGVLDHEIAAFRAARHQAESEREQQAQRLAKLTREAEDLRELFGKLEEERAAEEAAPKPQPAPPPKNAPTKLDPHSAVASIAPFGGRRITGSRGDLALPAVGRISGQYGDTLQPGTTRKGIDIETHEGAQVVAPFDGKVVFAGPFRAYGLLLIIEHSEGYHSLLAGMSRIDAEVGQRVLSGEPVGVMGAATDAQPTLYVELRRNGQPINPLPWLAARKGKANG